MKPLHKLTKALGILRLTLEDSWSKAEKPRDSGGPISHVLILVQVLDTTTGESVIDLVRTSGVVRQQVYLLLEALQKGGYVDIWTNGRPPLWGATAKGKQVIEEVKKALE